MVDFLFCNYWPLFDNVAHSSRQYFEPMLEDMLLGLIPKWTFVFRYPMCWQGAKSRADCINHQVLCALG